MVAEAVMVFHDPDQADGQAIGDRAADVARHAPLVPAADHRADGGMRVIERRLGDDVDRSARLAAAGQSGARALHHLDAFDRRAVDRGIIAEVAAEAVDQDIGPGVLVAREAADRIFVPQAAEIVLAGDAARIIQRIL